jgi:hypothetical protein
MSSGEVCSILDITETNVNQIRITVELTGQVRDDELAPAVRADLLNRYWRWFADENPCSG